MAKDLKSCHDAESVEAQKLKAVVCIELHQVSMFVTVVCDVCAGGKNRDKVWADAEGSQEES